jgi:UDP-glucose 4-epimerase
MTRVLVTGGQGLLGGAVARCLQAAGNEVVATCRSVTSTADGMEWRQAVDWFPAELTRVDVLAGLEPCDAVIHTAAMLPRTLDGSEAEATNNRRIDEAVFKAAGRWGANLVYASSVAVYEGIVPPAGGLTEDQPLQPAGPYAAEKAWAEEVGQAQARATGHPFTALRISAPYGPRQRATTVLRIFVERASRSEPLLYWGHGARQQDFIHADDVARAFVAALGHPGGTFNVSSGASVTMRELAEIVASAAGLSPSAVQAAGRPDPGEEARVAYRIDRAREVLGWEPAIALPDGVGAWLEYLREMETR